VKALGPHRRYVFALVTRNATAAGRRSIASPIPWTSDLLPLLPLLLAAVNFCWQLGSPSLHIDEAFSWSAADLPLGELLHQVRVQEVAPWTYYLGLHGWIGLLGSDSEWLMRLPSALAGVALVAVTYRIGLLVLDRRPALLAATLAAASPLILTYAQEVRAYAFAMLLVAIAVWAALEARRGAGPRRRRAWLAVLVASSIGAFWLHYTAALVLIPLYAWVLLKEGLGRRRGLVVVCASLLGSLPLLPLMLDQLSRGHEAGVAPSARLTAENFLRVVGTPYDGRSERLSFWLVLGAVALVAALLLVAVTDRERAQSEPRGLLLPLVIAPVLAVVAVTVVSDDVLISRYTAVAAPFFVLLVAWGTSVAPRSLAPLIAVAAFAAAGGASLDLHRSDGFYADVKGAFEAIGDRYRRGDVVLLRGYPAIGPIGGYYGGRELPRGAPLLVPDLIPAQKPALRQAIRDRRRLWSVDQLRLRPALRRGIVPRGYRRAGPRLRFPGAFDLQLTLAVPR
jgi:Dolichyl-phosphate-mannose-protein mannosyltransferase